MMLLQTHAHWHLPDPTCTKDTALTLCQPVDRDIKVSVFQQSLLCQQLNDAPARSLLIVPGEQRETRGWLFIRVLLPSSCAF